MRGRSPRRPRPPSPPMAAAGVTWWLAAFDAACDPAAARRFIRNGPPPAKYPAARQVIPLEQAADTLRKTMTHYKHLVIGGGMTAAAAVEGIREIDPDGAIGLISAETDPPYNRPPLSKGLWKGDPTLEGIWPACRSKESPCTSAARPRRSTPAPAGARRALAGLHVRQAAAGHRRHARAACPSAATTSSTTARWPTIAACCALAETGDRFAVIGGGFIGTEIAAALAMHGKHVVLLFPQSAIGARVYPARPGRVPHRLLPPSAAWTCAPASRSPASTAGGRPGGRDGPRRHRRGGRGRRRPRD